MVCLHLINIFFAPLLYAGSTYNATLHRVGREGFCEEVTFELKTEH